MNSVLGRAHHGGARLLEAAQWLTRLREQQDISSTDLGAWQEFMSSRENRDALERIHRVARTAACMIHPPLPSAAELAEDRYDGSVSVRRWRAREAGPVTQSFYAVRRRARPLRWLVGIAAVAAGTLAAVGLWLNASTAPGFHQVFQTAAGEQRNLTLSDGSTLFLGAETAVDIRFTAALRSIHLDHGEALFVVAHSPKRPFVVFAGRRTVTALGTEFNIWRNLDLTTVTVAQGTIEVDAIKTPSPDGATAALLHGTARMVKGQAMTYSEDGTSSDVEAADVSAAIAWREGQLVYRHVPLRYVVADVNRYFKEQFLINDLAVGELPFTGAVLQTQSAAEFAQALESVFPLEAVHLKDGRVLLRLRHAVVAKPPVGNSQTDQYPADASIPRADERARGSQREAQFAAEGRNALL
jgi:transmembrane sensor